MINLKNEKETVKWTINLIRVFSFFPEPTEEIKYALYKFTENGLFRYLNHYHVKNGDDDFAVRIHVNDAYLVAATEDAVALLIDRDDGSNFRYEIRTKIEDLIFFSIHNAEEICKMLAHGARLTTEDGDLIVF